MAYNAKADKNYNEKCNKVQFKYTEKENKEYLRLQTYLKDNNIQITRYLKQLIKRDLDAKNIPYISDVSEQQRDI